MVKGLLFAAFAACFTIGSSFLTVEKGTAEGLPPTHEKMQEKQAFHTVTFMVEGEVYALFEYVEDNTSLGEAMLADVCLAGYDFLGWTYGEGIPFTKDTLILSDMTVTATLRERPYTEEELAAYVIMQNVDFGAQVSLSHTDEEYGNYKIKTENATASMVYKFEYADKGDGELCLSLRDVFGGFGEGGYAFFFDGKAVRTPVGDIALDEADRYVVEVGAIDAVSGGKTYIFVKVNGETKAEGRVKTKLNAGSFLGVWGSKGATSAFLQVNAYMVGDNHYETLDEAYAQTGEEVLLIRDVDALSVKKGAPTLNLNGNCVGDIRIEGGELTLYGGAVMGDITLSEGSLIIKGGSFSKDVSAYLADGYHCVRTEEVYRVDKHEKRTVKGYAPTCTEKGLTDGEECAICGAILFAQESIDALGHQAEVLEEIPATCQTQGKTEGSYCSVCKEVLKEQENIPIVAHAYENGACKYCGKAEKEEDEDSANSSLQSEMGWDSAEAISSSGEAVSSSGEEEIDSLQGSSQSEGEKEVVSSGCAGSVEASFIGLATAVVTVLFGKKRKRTR